MNKFSFLIGILIIWFSHLIVDFMLGVWPIYKTLLALDLVIAGLIASVGMFIGEGLQLYFGILSDRGYQRPLMALGVSLTATIPFLAYVQDERVLFIFVLCAYIGSGAFHPAASSLLINLSSPYKSFLIALFSCGGMIGAASSQYLFTNIYHTREGDTWILVVPIAILVLSCILFDFPKSNKQRQEQIGGFKKIWQAIKDVRFELILLYIIHICLQIVVLSFGFLLPDILNIKGYEEWLCLGGGYFYFVIGAALASMPIGYCVDKFGYKSILGLIILGSIGFLSLFLVTESLSLFPMIMLLMLIGGTMGVIVPVVVAGGNSLVPTYASGLVSALYMGGTSCLAGFGPTFASLITRYLPANSPVTALQLLSGLLVFAFVLLYFLPQSFRYSEREKISIKIEA